jgi:hypothetical protein
VDPFRVDLAIAALFVVATAIELSLLDSEGHSRPITIAAGVLAVSGVAFRRRDPRLAAAIWSIPALLQAFLDGFLTSDSTVPFVAVILLFYSIGRYAPQNRFAAAAVLMTVGTMATLFVEGGFAVEDTFCSRSSS